MKAVDGQVDTRTPTLCVIRLMRLVAYLDKGTWTSGINMVIADQFRTEIIQMRLQHPQAPRTRLSQSSILIVLSVITYSLDDI